MEKVPVDKIKVGRRAREDLGDIDTLKTSIEKRGLINPICVSEDYGLIAGYRRLTCFKLLGIREIEVKFYHELSNLEKLRLELEENLHKELTWYEQAKIRAQIHEIEQQEHGKPTKGHESNGWTLADSAESLGVSPATLSQDVELTRYADYIPQLKQFISKRQALKLLRKAKETAGLIRMSELDIEEAGISTPYTIHQGDAPEILLKYVADETIDMTIFDPPWGIDADINVSSRVRGDKVEFDDSEFAAKQLAVRLVPEIYRVMKQNSHMYVFFGIEHYEFWLNLLRQKINPEDPESEQMFSVRVAPLVWIKEGGAFTDFEVRFMPRYELILFCSKGLRRLNTPCSDIFDFKRPASVERIHTQQKPVELLQQMIRLSTVPGQIVLDPCMGSGSSVVAASLSKRRSVGIEKLNETFLKAKDWINSIILESLELDEEDEDEDGEGES